ncbi:MAG: hypothetical protein ACREV4_03065 [Gammaproteobacteria bacterium]
MALEQEAIAEIEAIVYRTLEEWQKSAGYSSVRYELDLRERIVRVEEELKHQRKLMLEGFTRMDKRLEAMQQQIDQRFEQIDKRFEQIDKRIDTLTRRIDRFMLWSFATTLTVGGIVIAVLKLT